MSVLLRGATLIDGRGGPPLRGASVLIDGDKFARVGPDGSFPAPSDARQINLTGKWLLPGLIDLHVHLYNPFEEVDVAPFTQPDPMATLFATRKLALYPRAGITTVRDVGSYRPISLALREGVQDGVIPGPRIFTCGRFVSQTGGHGDDIHADGVDGVRRTVREMWKQRADLIKIAVNGHRGVQEFTRAELDAIVDEAHRLGLRVACHASMLEATREAVAAGIDTIEHGCHLDPALAEAMAAKKIVMVPTIGVYWTFIEESKTRSWPTEYVEALKQKTSTHKEAVSLALAAGVRLGAGTDVNIYAHPHALAEELEYLVKYGVPPMQAIQAATSVAAEALGKSDQLGTIEAGKIADCVVLGQDPLEHVGATRRVELVFKDGTRVETGHLSLGEGVGTCADAEPSRPAPHS